MKTTKELIYDGPHPAQLRGIGRGRQRVYKFANGYGASVVQFRLAGLDEIAGGFGGSYTKGGEWELAVITFDVKPNMKRPADMPYEPFELCYTTDITADVIGHLSETEVSSLLKRIKALPARQKPTPKRKKKLN